ncbi:SDR family NAD(P)-dependent oxidoreductase [uncultured Draconibacterium sp.]|uniref:SDR family NAD(P)-dependent oxidoreductase n=1 Tax=uncultured Draconibacterium sp. TaxID=1573823 RepID=UPI0025FE1205|nr:SDR family NAD(P)-dependent oxidoreductase [uncultured Draconibacterium sp.]
MQKQIFISGSTDGIGKLAAIQLATNGHSVHLHGRNPKKLKEAILEVKKVSGNEAVNGFVADLSDFDAVNQLATEIAERIPRLDVLINNAGVYKSPVQSNKDGLDMRFVVNYLAPFLLTKRLLPVLGITIGSRIINLSSAAQSAISYDALAGTVPLPDNTTYAMSKLALTMWSFYLAGQLKNTTVIAVNPGSLLNTKMVQEAFGRSWSAANKGADILYELATAKEHMARSGQYFDNDSGNYAKAHPAAYKQTEIEQLIKATEVLLEKYKK